MINFNHPAIVFHKYYVFGDTLMVHFSFLEGTFEHYVVYIEDCLPSFLCWDYDDPNGHGDGCVVTNEKTGNKGRIVITDAGFLEKFLKFILIHVPACQTKHRATIVEIINNTSDALTKSIKPKHSAVDPNVNYALAPIQTILDKEGMFDPKTNTVYYPFNVEVKCHSDDTYELIQKSPIAMGHPPKKFKLINPEHITAVKKCTPHQNYEVSDE